MRSRKDSRASSNPLRRRTGRTQGVYQGNLPDDHLRAPGLCPLNLVRDFMSTITYKAPLKSSPERALCGDEVLACAKIKPIDNRTVVSRKDRTAQRRGGIYVPVYSAQTSQVILYAAAGLTNDEIAAPSPLPRNALRAITAFRSGRRHFEFHLLVARTRSFRVPRSPRSRAA